MTDAELMALLLRIDPQTKRIPPAVRAIVDAVLAVEREPFAWAVLCDGVLHSFSHTELNAKLRAETIREFREANQGRGWLVEVIPLYRALAPAAGAASGGSTGSAPA